MSARPSGWAIPNRVAMVAGLGESSGGGPSMSLAALLVVLSLLGACRATPRPTLPRTPFAVPAATGPASQADLASGAAIYEEHCVACHGPSGRGDGPAAAALQPPPSDFTEWSATADATALDYYQAVTQGIPGTAMLRWDHALRPEERWDVALYLWLLPFDQERLGAVASHMQRECASCHAEDGTPPLAQPDWTAVSRQELRDRFGAAHPRMLTGLSEEHAEALPGALILQLTTDSAGWPPEPGDTADGPTVADPVP